MKAVFKVSPNLQFEVEEDKQTDLFEQLASCQEVFGIVGSEECRLCKNKNLHFKVRQNSDEDKFYEIVCEDCGGKLAISVNKKGGTIYPVRKLKDGLPAKISDEPPFDWSTKGWHKYDKDKMAKKPIITNPAQKGNKK